MEYARCGLRVIPLRPRSKSPFMKGWPDHATSDERVIRPWFEVGLANVGIVTGEGIMALDVDARKGGLETLRKLLRWGRFPRTAHARTGGGGRHILLRYDPARWRVRGRNDVFPGIDIKADGGLIVAPPSVHPDTRRAYSWYRAPSKGIADIPDWLLADLAYENLATPAGEPGRSQRTGVSLVSQDDRLRRSDDEQALVEEMIQQYPVGGHGQRNDRLMRLVASMIGRRLRPELVHTVAVAWWIHYHELGLIATPPTEADQMVSATIRSVLTKAGSPEFPLPPTEEDHRRAVCAISLATHTLLMPPSPPDSEEQKKRGPEAEPDQIRIDSHPPGLCRSENERAFVEALIALSTYQLGRGKREISLTNAQIAAVAHERREVDISHPQKFERLKTRFISRPADGKPASRHELLTETRKGWKDADRPAKPGEPSIYEPTGILGLVAESLRHVEIHP
jgi:hypothetical protein